MAVPDPRVGDRVMAAVRIRDDATFSPDRFGEFLATQPDLGTKWAPHLVRIVDTIPLTGTGKVDRQPLRAERWDTTDPVWWRPGRKLEFVRLTAPDIERLHQQFSDAGRHQLLA